MDAEHFDALLRVLATDRSRRAALRVLVAATVGGTLASHMALGDTAEVAAKRRQRHHARSRQRHHRRRKQVHQNEVGCAKAGQKVKPDKPCCPDSADDGSGRCVSLGCDVCAGDCPYDTVQAAIDDDTGPTTIHICPGTYLGVVNITRNVTLIGAGEGADPSTNTILQGTNSLLVMIVSQGIAVNLQDLRITGGRGEAAGGIQNDGDLTLTRCTVSGNTSDAHAGGIFNSPQGTLTLTNSTVSGNTAEVFGGGIYSFGDLTLNGSIVSGNSAANEGGGISNVGTLTLNDSVITGNTATNYGGGIGTASAGQVTLTGCTLSGNTAGSGGGGLSAAPTDGPVNLTDCTVSDNTVSFNGGGLYNRGTMTLTGSTTVSGNTAAGAFGGGGIFNGQDGTLTLTNSTVIDNDATDSGGGITNNGALTIQTSQVTSNHAGVDGGGVHNSAGTVSCIDSGIVSGNTVGVAGAQSNCIDALGGLGCETCNPV